MDGVDAPPIALFVSSAGRPHPLIAIAAAAGFRALQASSHSCESLDNGVLVRGGFSASKERRLSTLEHAVLARPAVVTALTLSNHGLSLITDIVLRSDALVGCLSQLGDMPTAGGMTYAAFGVARFDPAESLILEDAYVTGNHDETATVPPTQLLPGLTSLLRDWAKDAKISHHDLLHRVCAPCGLALTSHARLLLADPFYFQGSDYQLWCALVGRWLAHIYGRVTPPSALRVPSDSHVAVDTDGIAAFIPVLFDTPTSITTTPVAGTVVYMHEDLQPSDASSGGDKVQQLVDLLCRRRAKSPESNVDGDTIRRLVEPGVGRAVLTDEVCVPSLSELRDYTVLGVGLTPYSEGGYVEIGRTIDGKASLVRAWHRKYCAERLEAHGCRAGRVLAIIRLDDEVIDMPDGSVSPAALVVRGFRCSWRVKQLDPLICLLHSIQHTPLIYDYLLRSVRELTRSGTSLDTDEDLARELEAQLASQESLRVLVGESFHSSTPVQRVRLKLIKEYAPLLIRQAKRRLASELGPPEDDESWYLQWFSESLGLQLNQWRDLRFLHDYHHPGVSRWSPGHLYTLAENNVTLLAEFPDLDTGIFVDDNTCDSFSALQLSDSDVAVLRDNYELFHERDVRAAATVVRTLSGLMLEDPSLTESRLASFWRAYGHNR